LLPVEIKNRIAEFLPFKDRESESEFIKRTKIPKPVPLESYKHILSTFTNFFNYTDCHAVFCPNKNNIAVLELLQGELNATPRLTILNPKKKRPMHTQDLEMSRFNLCKLIALSSCGHIFANIQKIFNKNSDEIENVLIIKNIKIQKTERLVIPDSFFHMSSVSFNKQGTHVIVHDTDTIEQTTWADNSSEIEERQAYRHLIFPLAPDIQNADANGKLLEKTLSEYFRQHYICKQ